MGEISEVPDTIFSSSPLRRVVHFDDIASNASHPSAPSISLLTLPSSNSLSLPLVAEKPGVRFKLLILLLGLFIALLIGLALSLLLVTQFIQNPTPTTTSLFHHRPMLTKTNSMNNSRLFEHLLSSEFNEFDFNLDVCENFYGFTCRKWLANRPLSVLEFKRSWLTERSKDIRQDFARQLAELSANEVNLPTVYSYENNQTEEGGGGAGGDGFVAVGSTKNELEQFYSIHDGYEDDNDHHRLRRQLNDHENDLSHSISNMFAYYQQCLHTSESILLDQLKQLAHDHFWFTNNDQHGETSSNTRHRFLFEQMIEHPLMHIWHINTINIGTQTIVHVQRRIQDQYRLSLYQAQQANLFEHYVKRHHIDLCHQSSRTGPLANTLKEYNELMLTSLSSSSNTSVRDDLHRLISNNAALPIIYSSVRHVSDLRDIIQYMSDKQIIASINDTRLIELFSSFSLDLQQQFSNLPTYRSTISFQCHRFLNYYIRFRSYLNTKYEPWFDYISASIIQLIVHAWPGDASYTCLYSTLVRHTDLESIPYWNTFLTYAKDQKQFPSLSPVITVELRLIDFFQLDSTFRFLFADQFAHYCNLMIYKYGPKLLPFVSIFHKNIQINLKNLWQQFLQDNIKQQSRSIRPSSLTSTHVPEDCLTLVEYFYPFTLSSFYEQYMSNKTDHLHSVALELRDLLLLDHSSDKQLLSTIQFHILPERLKLFHDLLPLPTYIPYEYYLIEDNYLSTTWNIIESHDEGLVQPTHEFFEINGHHTVEQGIFLQPTVAELFSNNTTHTAALLLVAHELGHAVCPCGTNATEREYLADLIAVRLVMEYNEQQINMSNETTITSIDKMKTFFLIYGRSECLQINREMISLMNNNEQNIIEPNVNRVLRVNDQFQSLLNCSSVQRRRSKPTNIIPEMCVACRKTRS